MNISGININFQPGNPKTRDNDLLFVHGMWAGSWMWDQYKAFFINKGFDCYALDLRGRPDSIPVYDRGKISINDYVQDVKVVAEQLNTPIIIGHSMGGLLTQKVAELLSPSAIILIGPTPPAGIFMLGGWIHMTMGLVYGIQIILGNAILPNQFFMRQLLMNEIPDTIQDSIYGQLVPESSRVALEILYPGVPVNESQVECPMLIIASPQDHATPISTIHRIVKKYNCDLKTYSGFGHMIPIEPEWEKPAQDILEWIDTHVIT
ncbi:MAG: hydrolase or acyltransferase [Candidatus Magnetoglobus multicellularis str. Araruama]|uniref:Hydrolase or acyltransferase n=1 Tax=Candidatus Magnetoglobus multicellularis str. Araruama TaxID=890399 RepID=A0A1V1PHW9_9BACT|nr:MAG: hydrolase or acyltransferase [Candidatus Magnetoglobus multicellularis str. Araruama]